MTVDIKDRSFTVKIKGEITQEEYAGVFKTRIALPHRLQLERDRIRRELIGKVDQAAPTPRAANAAEIFSTLAVHLTAAPKWWSEADNGMELLDDAVVSAVYEGSMSKVNEFHKELAAASEVAKKDLAATSAVKE